VDILAGGGRDDLTYTCTAGSDVVYIDGGGGWDELAIYANFANLTVRDKKGNLIFQRGVGGTTIRLRRVPAFTVYDDDGVTPLYAGGVN